MSHSVAIYTQGKMKLGTGTATKDSTTISSFTETAGSIYSQVHDGRNILISPTSGNSRGMTVAARVVTDGGTSITLGLPYPLAD